MIIFEVSLFWEMNRICMFPPAYWQRITQSLHIRRKAHDRSRASNIHSDKTRIFGIANTRQTFTCQRQKARITTTKARNPRMHRKHIFLLTRFKGARKTASRNHFTLNLLRRRPFWMIRSSRKIRSFRRSPNNSMNKNEGDKNLKISIPAYMKDIAALIIGIQFRTNYPMTGFKWHPMDCYSNLRAEMRRPITLDITSLSWRMKQPD